ncbi:MAG: ribonuclease III domain-containing protein [Methanocalculus sp.]|uniref:ribonuclease III domain-containing protein n=1 Tax=Methanocalculus sp. TaxID=2004547 RepID=UPI0027279462|nr:ribonuclease III domain-containing protein [Methanocalculus sp.]MDO8842535.1 ribonuclease III domain-containing protein [Methanocalculus sp.]MDO9539640.1 ribonuclease III domain-containing protein [Methanocalculus sp.]
MIPLEEAIGYTFSDPSLLTRALTRSAYAREAGLPNSRHMDAFAVLGDAAIELAVIEEVIAAGEFDKGVITNIKVNAVNMLRLRMAAESLDLALYVRWGKGEKTQGIWTSGRVLAECYEALIGALYLDSGINDVKKVLYASGILSNKKD